MARRTGSVSTVIVAGPLAPFADAYEEELRDRGYAARTIVNQQRQVARLSGWLVAGGLTVAALSGERLEQFCDAAGAGGTGASLSRQGLIALLDVLRGLGVIELELPASVDSSDELLLARFGDYLLKERGLTTGTAVAYVGYARRFLVGLAGGGELSGVTAGVVTAAGRGSLSANPRLTGQLKVELPSPRHNSTRWPVYQSSDRPHGPRDDIQRIVESLHESDLEASFASIPTQVAGSHNKKVMLPRDA